MTCLRNIFIHRKLRCPHFNLKNMTLIANKIPTLSSFCRGYLRSTCSMSVKSFGTRSCSTSSSTNPNPEENSAGYNTKDERLKILYDGECPLCESEISLLKWWTRKNDPVNFVDITKGEYRPEDHMGITFEEAMGNMHAIGPDKTIYKKMNAIREMYRATGFGWFADFTAMRGIKPVADKSYDIFAKYRFKLQGKTYEECVAGRCKIQETK